MTVPKHFVKGGDTKFYRYPCEPECQWCLILVAIGDTTGPQPSMQQLFVQE